MTPERLVIAIATLALTLGIGLTQRIPAQAAEVLASPGSYDTLCVIQTLPGGTKPPVVCLPYPV